METTVGHCDRKEQSDDYGREFSSVHLMDSVGFIWPERLKRMDQETDRSKMRSRFLCYILGTDVERFHFPWSS